MKAVVTNRQIFFILVFTLTSGSLVTLPKDAIAAAGTGAWFSIMLLTIIFAMGVFVITSLNKRFEGKTIFEYSKILVGKPAALIIGFIYASYFLLVLTLLFRIAAELIKGSFLFLTPIWALLFLFIATSLYIASKGITSIGRMCEMYGILFILVSFAVHASMLVLGDMEQVKPFFEIEKTKEYIFGVKDLFVAFLGIEIFTIIPFGKSNNKKGILYSVAGVVYTGLSYIFIVETSAMIVGMNDIVNYDNSLIIALRETRLPSTILLERVDLLFPTVGVLGIVSGLCVLFFTTVENTYKLFNMVDKKVLLIMIGIITYIISAFLISTELATSLFSTIVPFFGLLTAFIIPVTLLIIAKVKKYEN